MVSTAETLNFLIVNTKKNTNNHAQAAARLAGQAQATACWLISALFSASTIALSSGASI